MQRTSIRLCFFFVAFNLVFSLPLFAQEKKIQIGFIGSLTGPDPSYGAAMRGGVEISMKEINDRGGVKGHLLEIIFEDGGCINSKAAVSAVHKLVDIDHVPAIIGGGCSNEVLSAAPIVNRNKTFLLSSGATSPTVMGAGPFVFRNAANDQEISAALANRLVSRGSRRLAILSDETDYSEGFRRAFLKELRSLGVDDVLDIRVLPGLSDYRSDLLRLKNKPLDAIFVNPNGSAPSGLIVRQTRLLGIKAPIYLAYNTSGTFLESAGEFAEGVVAIDLPMPNSALAAKVLSSYRSRFGSESPYPYNTVAAYDALNIIANAIKLGFNSGVAIRDYVAALAQYEGALGKYKFGVQGGIEGLGYRFKEVKRGHWVNLP